MRLRMVLAIWLVLFLNIQGAYSQTTEYATLTGKVIDEETGMAIQGAHIYFSQTTIGAASGADGSFQLTTNLTGSHTLVVSFIGYRTVTEEVNLSEPRMQEFLIYLMPQPIELGSLVVTESVEDRDRYDEWKIYYNRFVHEFLGISDEANETQIMNSWVIGFEIGEEDLFTAHAEEPIIIQNNTFGYEIEVDLVEFMMSHEQNMVRYLFYSRFREMETDSRREMRKWEVNREDSYKGSFEHFLKTLYEGSLQESNFQIEGSLVKLTEQTGGSEDPDQASGIPREESVQKHMVPSFQLSKHVVVRYSRGLFGLSARNESTLETTTDNGIIKITSNGRLLHPLSPRLYGDWGNDRIANLLPIDYSPVE